MPLLTSHLSLYALAAIQALVRVIWYDEPSSLLTYRDTGIPLFADGEVRNCVLLGYARLEEADEVR